MSERREMRILIALLFLAVLSGCGDGLFQDTDCVFGECPDEPHPGEQQGEEFAEEADYDLGDRSEFDRLDVGDDLIVTGEVTEEYAELHFEAEAGDWYDVSVYSLGLPKPSFVVRPDLYRYERWSPKRSSGLTHRSLVTAYDRTHTVQIHSDHFGPRSDRASAPSEGGWDFVVHLERRSPPEPTVVRPDGSTERTVELGNTREHLYQIEVAPETAMVRVEPLTTGQTALQSGENLETTHRDTILPGVDAEDDVVDDLLLDYRFGTTKQHYYSVEFTEVEGIRVGAAVEESRSVESGEVLIAQVIGGKELGVTPRLAIEVERDGELIDDYRWEPGEGDDRFYGIGRVAEEEKVYDVRFVNERDRPVTELDTEVSVVEPQMLDDVTAPDQHMVNRAESMSAGDVDVVSFELEEHVDFHARFEEQNSPVTRLFQESLAGESIESFSGARDRLGDPIILEPGQYHLLIESEGAMIEEGYELELDFEKAHQFVYTDTVDVERGDTLVVDRPFGVYQGPEKLPQLMATDDDISLTNTEEMVGYMQIRMPIPETGQYDIELRGPWWDQQIEPDIEAVVVDGQQLGDVSIADSPVDSDDAGEDTSAESYIFELQEPAWVEWTLDENFGSSGTIERTVVTRFDDEFEYMTGQGFTGDQLATGLEAGTYLVTHFAPDDFDASVFLEFSSIPERFAVNDSELKLPSGEYNAASLPVDVDDCSDPQRVALELEFALDGDARPEVVLESPSEASASVWHTMGYHHEDIYSVLAPDIDEPDELMDPLIADSANGSWTVHVHDGLSWPTSILRSSTLNLWCE